MALRLGTAARNAGCDAELALLNVGGAGTISWYTGAQPATVAGNPSGTLLGTNTFSATAYGASATGTATANAIANDTSADNSGTVAHGCWYNNAASPIMDADAAQGSGTCNFDNSVVVSGGIIAVSSATHTVPIQ